MLRKKHFRNGIRATKKWILRGIGSWALRGTMLTAIGNCRGPSYLEAERFSNAAGCKVSDTAIRKARAKIDPEAFYELFQRTAAVVPQEKKYHGYQLIAVDGMKGELPLLRPFPHC